LWTQADSGRYWVQIHPEVKFSIAKKSRENRTNLERHNMSATVGVCTVDPALLELVKKLKFKSSAVGEAIVMKVDLEKQIVIEDETLEDVTIDELRDSLCEHEPRFVAYSFCHTHGDGHKSYPLAFLFSSPPGCKTEMAMMYAGSKNTLVRETKMTRLLEVRDLEDLTEEWVKKTLKLS